MANNKKNLKNQISRNYIAKDFDSMRLDLQRFAQTYYPDNMQDFSEASLGGLLLDLAAYVGDSMSFYTDHQFRELDPQLAVETKNIEKMAQNAGLTIPGASPSVVDVTFYIRILAEDVGGNLRARRNSLPIIKANTVLKSSIGVKFYLIEDLDFSKVGPTGDLIAETTRALGTGGREYFVLTMEGTCVSGELVTETFTIPNNHTPFRTLTLSNPDVSTILQVTDSSENEYYQVESLSQDTIFKSFPNPNELEDNVQSNLAILPAPYRFIVKNELRTRKSKIQFGSGKSSTIADDGVPDPSSLSLPLYGKKVMSRFSLDPALMLDTKTLGISPQNTTISVTYRYGGGASHNVSPLSIGEIDGLQIVFKDSVSGSEAIDIRSSIEVENNSSAAGGADRPSIEEIRSLIPSARNLQSRVVTREDLLARLYMLPNEYGRLFRAGIIANPFNPLASILFICSRNKNGNLSRSPDVLKKNISKYLNEYRMISDAIDILDVRIVNFRISISIVAAPNSNKMIVSRSVLDSVKKLFKLEKFQIGQHIVESDIINAIINVPGVLSLIELKLEPITGIISNRAYAPEALDFEKNKINGIYFCEQGDIFELRYPNEDINITIR